MSSKIPDFLTKTFVFSVLLISTIHAGYSQNRNILLCTDEDSPVILTYRKSLESITDSTKLIFTLNKALNSIHGQGYLMAAYQVKPVDSIFSINFNVGTRFNWAALKRGNIPDFLLSKIGYRQRFFLDKPFKQDEIQRLFTKAVKESENNGHPFASIHLDSILVSEDHIFGVLNYNQGPEITFDKIQIKGTDKVKTEWLAAYLDIKEGALFNQKSVDNISDKVSILPFVELKYPVEITFQNSQATVLIALDDVKANNIDGIVGFLPNDREQGKLLVTGQFDLGLTNLFSAGKSLDIKWQSLKPRSQLLNVEYNHTNLFRSNIDILSSFGLLKEDTVFINREGELATVFRKPKYTWKVFYRAKNTSVLSDNLNRNDLADIKINYYGSGFGVKTYSTKRIRKKGIGVDIEAAAGSKSIKNNSKLPETTYENIDLNTVQYLLGGSLTNYINVSKYLVLYQRTKAGKLFNDFLFLNDLYRLGGLTTIRGFNENFFFASDYAFSNLELQLHFQSDSYLFMFYDQAYLYYNVKALKYIDYPAGLGLGLSFKVQKGLINIVYGVGRSKDQSFDLKLSKFHFGYVARF
jgi:hypothetical protein